MPAPNERRRTLLTDAAIDLLAEAGVHGLSHRMVERRAGLPNGTASNYFRSRESLLVATAARLGELHRADRDAARAAWGATSLTPAAASGSTTHQTIELITASLLAAATLHRTRWLAVFELRLEAVRRPALARALDDGESPSGLDALCDGMLFALVTGPADEVSAERVRALVTPLVVGPAAPSPPPSRIA